jgi:hypothetical protein
MGNRMHPGDRRVLLALIGVTIVLGGLSRLVPLGIPWWDKYVGDVAYAACASFGIALVWDRLPVSIPSAIALAVCIAIECFQLTGIPLQLNRSDILPIRIFAYLVLGSGFSWWDMLAYVVGVALAALGDAYLARRSIRSVAQI